MIEIERTLSVGKRYLGKAGIEVSPIGLGCWQFAGGGTSTGFWKSPPQDVIDEIVRVSLESGINWFDTAEGYGFGGSERALSGALTHAGKADGNVVIATKWMPVMRTAASIRNTIGNRQRHLAPFHIDLHQIHLPLSLSSVEAQMNAMADLIEQKKTRAAGVSNFSAEQMHRAHKTLAERGFPLASNQVPFSLLNRSIEKNGILDAASELNITIVAYSPLAQGLLTGRFHQNPGLINRLPIVRRIRLGRLVQRSRPLVGALGDIARSYGLTASQIALNWLVNFHGDAVVAIPGASQTEQARQNAGAMAFRLSQSEMAKLDELSREFIYTSLLRPWNHIELDWSQINVPKLINKERRDERGCQTHRSFEWAFGRRTHRD